MRRNAGMLPAMRAGLPTDGSVIGRHFSIRESRCAPLPVARGLNPYLSTPWFLDPRRHPPGRRSCRYRKPADRSDVRLHSGARTFDMASMTSPSPVRLPPPKKRLNVSPRHMPSVG
jgi:hypothetical protein